MLTQLIRAIIILILITLPFWIAMRVKINISRKNRDEKLSVKREFILGSLFIYTIVVAAITIVPLPISRFRDPGYSGINVVPLLNSLKCVLPDRAGRQHPMAGFCLQNMIGNIILFLPLGALLPFASEKFRTIKRVLLAALFFSLSIEAIQFVSRFFGSYRSIDVDDVLFNTSGAFLGFIIYTMVKNVFSKKLAA